jgi:hypothetical protein
MATTAQRKIEDIANHRAERGETVSSRLLSVANEKDNPVASAVAFRLNQCASRENLFIGNDLHKDAECFDATGNLFACGSRLCLSCNANLARETRKKARIAVEKLGAGGYFLRWRSLVLTMPLMEGADVSSAINKINDAFRRMTNREFWKSRVKGGIKSVEFTVRPDGYHAHIHLLVLSEHIPINGEVESRFGRLSARRELFSGNLADELAHCLRASGVELEGSPVCAVFDVRNRNQKATGNREISLEKALLETCKYLTKSESWDEIPDAALIAIAEIERWSRMFEVLGKSRNELAESESETPNDSLVHKKTLSNGEKLPTWRKILFTMDFQAWKREMMRRINLIRAFRRSQLSETFHLASFRTLSGENFGNNF